METLAESSQMNQSNGNQRQLEKLFKEAQIAGKRLALTISKVNQKNLENNPGLSEYPTKDIDEMTKEFTDSYYRLFKGRNLDLS